MVLVIILCGVFGFILTIIGAFSLCKKGSRETGGWLTALGIILFLVALISVAKIGNANIGTPRGSLTYADFPGKEYEVVKVVGKYGDKIDLVILVDGERIYISISLDRVLNKEIPEDIKVLRAMNTRKDAYPAYVFGDIEYAGSDFFKK